YFTTPRSSETARSSSGCRRLGRIVLSRSGRICKRKLLGAPASGDKRRRSLGTRQVVCGTLLCLRPVRASARMRLAFASPNGQFSGESMEGLLSHDVPIGTTQVSLAQLNERSRDIFRQIVESYLATGEPVGSRNISRLITTPLSPASVRNVMSDLEQLGLVYAPHISAGRLPTEFGLRFFVDALMEIGDLGEADRREMEAKVAAAGKSIDAVLNEASGMLSGLTRAAGVVLAAKLNVRLKHIEFVRLEPERALVILVSEDGQVENRVIAVPTGLPPSALTEAS